MLLPNLPSRYAGFEPANESRPAPTLAVILHGSVSFESGFLPAPLGPESMADIIRAVKEANGQDVDIYAPALPYVDLSDGTGGRKIVAAIVDDLDCLWEWASKSGSAYQKIVFIGHCMGGTILRRVFLAGSYNSPDYDKLNQNRDDLYEAMKPGGLPRPWASKVDRIVLLASWEKGWSVSPRTGWWFSFWLNLIGALGRVIDLVRPHAEQKPFGTVLDMRQGAPFIVQTRLIWMAYRRWLNPEALQRYNDRQPERRMDAPPEDANNPLVIQIIGSRDDFVPPQEQIDCDAEGLGAIALDQPRKYYFLFEMADATHVGVLDLNSDANRKAIFLGALQKTVAELDQPAQGSALGEASRDPLQFLDAPPEIHEEVASVAFVIHGIRDDGSWTHRVAAAIKSEWDLTKLEGQMEVYPTWTHSYGYFPMLPFVLPWIRKSKVEWFMDNYVSVKAAYPYATFHYVGHSNGTYLAATALKDYPAARFGTVYFAGSVVHPNYNWKRALDCHQIKKFHNARGGEDWVVALLPKSLEYFSDLGGGGFDGFDEANVENGQPTWPKAPNCFTQSEKFAKGGHGGAISEAHWGEIAKFIVSGVKPFAAGEPERLFAPGQDRFFRILGALRIGAPLGFGVAALLVLLAVLFPLFDHWRFNVVAVTLLGIGWLTFAAKLIMRPETPPATAPKTPPAEKTTPTWLIWGMSCSFIALSVLAAGVVAGTGGWLWGGALAAFLGLQYCSERDWSKLAAAFRTRQRSAIFDSWRLQRAPTGRPARVLLGLFVALAAVFLLWALWSLLSIFAGLSDGVGGAVTRFFLIVLTLWFVLTRV